MNERNDAAEALARAIEGEIDEGRDEGREEDSRGEEQDQEAWAETAPLAEVGGAATESAEHADEGIAEAGASEWSGRRRRTGGGSVAGARPRREAGPTPVAKFTVKACLVLGMLLVVPGLWAIGLLANLPVPMAEKGNADAVAYLMLLCWPIAAILIGGALFYARQHAMQSRHEG